MSIQSAIKKQYQWNLLNIKPSNDGHSKVNDVQLRFDRCVITKMFYTVKWSEYGTVQHQLHKGVYVGSHTFANYHRFGLFLLVVVFANLHKLCKLMYYYRCATCAVCTMSCPVIQMLLPRGQQRGITSITYWLTLNRIWKWTIINISIDVTNDN